jgi:hypothetical protein
MKFLAFFLVFFLGLACSACNLSSDQVQVEEQQPLELPVPTDTEVPTPTTTNIPLPSNTPQPTATHRPESTATPNLLKLQGVSILSYAYLLNDLFMVTIQVPGGVPDEVYRASLADLDYTCQIKPPDHLICIGPEPDSGDTNIALYVGNSDIILFEGSFSILPLPGLEASKGNDGNDTGHG